MAWNDNSTLLHASHMQAYRPLCHLCYQRIDLTVPTEAIEEEETRPFCVCILYLMLCIIEPERLFSVLMNYAFLIRGNFSLLMGCLSRLENSELIDFPIHGFFLKGYVITFLYCVHNCLKVLKN